MIFYACNLRDLSKRAVRGGGKDQHFRWLRLSHPPHRHSAHLCSWPPSTTSFFENTEPERPEIIAPAFRIESEPSIVRYPLRARLEVPTMNALISASDIKSRSHSLPSKQTRYKRADISPIAYNSFLQRPTLLGPILRDFLVTMQSKDWWTVSGTLPTPHFSLPMPPWQKLIQIASNRCVGRVDTTVSNQSDQLGLLHVRL